MRETTDFHFYGTNTPHGDTGVVAVMWRGFVKAMLER
jgi:hypothetical protein